MVKVEMLKLAGKWWSVIVMDLVMDPGRFPVSYQEPEYEWTGM